MKIFANNFILNNIPAKELKFTSNPAYNSDNKQVTQLSEVVPSYNVSVPMGYTKIEDINLPNGLTAHYYKLNNGQKVVIIPKDGTTVIDTYVNTGSLNEPDRVRGISHYIEHNLFNGSEALGNMDFFGEVNKIGANTNASTSFSLTDYYIKSNLLDDSDLEKEIKLHAGMIQTPKFLEEKLAKEKKIVNSEINMCLSDDHTRAESITLKNLFNIKSDAPDLVAGSTNNIDNLTRQDVVDYFKNNYYPSNMVTVVTGEVDEAQTINLISKYFTSNVAPSGQRYHEKMTVTDKPIRHDMISAKKTGASDVFIGFAGPENSNYIDKIHLRAVNQLLFGLSNSRMKSIEQKYSASIFPMIERLGTRGDDKTGILINTSVQEQYVEPLLKDVYNVIGNLAQNPPTIEEFDAIKTQIKKINNMSLQSSESLNFHVADDFLNGTPYKTAQYDLIIDNMTYQDFINTVNKYYNLNKTAVTVVHPKNTTAESVNNNYKAAQSAAVSFTGLNKKTPIDMSKVQQYRMWNNYEVVLQDTDSDIVDYSLMLDTKNNSPKKAAVADILSDMFCYCGTNRYSWEDLAAISDKNGIGSSLKISNSACWLSGNFPVNKTDIALDMFRDNLFNPRFTQELFNNSVQHCRDKYKSAEPNAYQNFNKAIYSGMHQAYSKQDKLASLDSITINDVIALYNEILSGSQGQITVTAPFSKHPELAYKIFNNASQMNTVKPKNTALENCYKPIDKTEVYTAETNKNQAQVLQGYKFNVNGNIKDEMCINLLNSILGDGAGSRLFNDLREQRHLAYTVSSAYEKCENIGVMSMRIKTTTNNTETGEKSLDNIKKSLDGFRDNIEKITNEKVSDEELDTAKKALKSQVLDSLEMNYDKNFILADSVTTPYGADYVNKQFEVIDSITPEDIQNTARYIFSSKPVYSVAATKEALDYNKNYLDSLK